MSGGKNSQLAVHAPASRCGISWQKQAHPRLARKLLVIPRVATNDRSIGPLDLLAADDLGRHLRAAEAAILRDARRQRRRRDYFVLDRYRLGYLNAIEKVNCTYCSYANGLIAYIREIAARTEQYWCPIKHGRRVRSPHSRYALFADFGDAAGYRARSGKLRTALAGRHRRTITFARRNGLR